jgi:predicted GNAT family N-acyltransferase
MNTVSPCSVSIDKAVLSEKEITDKIFAIRNHVFVEEQQVDRDEEFDIFEVSSLHYLGSCNGIPAGTARWRFTEKGIKLERFAVEKSMRGTGIGKAVLAEVLKDVIPFRKKIYLHAQVSAMGFYEKAGFKKEGPMFSEANIDHFLMTYGE